MDTRKEVVDIVVELETNYRLTAWQVASDLLLIDSGLGLISRPL